MMEMKRLRDILKIAGEKVLFNNYPLYTSHVDTTTKNVNETKRQKILIKTLVKTKEKILLSIIFQKKTV